LSQFDRLNTIEMAGVIREISKHIANRTIKRHNTQILTAINSGVLSGNTLTGTLGADTFYDLASAYIPKISFKTNLFL
jgi:hypothetical protein